MVGWENLINRTIFTELFDCENEIHSALVEVALPLGQELLILQSIGQIWPKAYFCTIHKLRMVFEFSDRKQFGEE